MPRLILFNEHSSLGDWAEFQSRTSAQEFMFSVTEIDKRIANSPVPLRFSRRAQEGKYYIVRVFAYDQPVASAWIIFESQFELNVWWAAISHRMGAAFKHQTRTT